MRIFESVEFTLHTPTRSDTRACGKKLCHGLELVTELIRWIPDGEYVEAAFFEVGQASNDFIPAVRFPFWRRHEGLLRSEWPQWFLDDFDDHVRYCSQGHNFPTRGVYSHSAQAHLN